ncbi:MAG TPA: phosphotransferase [Thermoanaerobaculia bacterium]|nr:phosphotransferase [Thermoanaerobaculia bacterium]
MTASDLPPEAVTFLNEWLGSEWQTSALEGDASVRQYFRLASGGDRYMLAYYPEVARDGVSRFVASYRAIERFVSVPAVVRHSVASVVQQDVGDETLFDLLYREPERAVALYRDAIDLLLRFQHSEESAASLNPAFTSRSFRQELEMTRDFYLDQLLESPQADSVVLRSLMDELCEKVASHPYVLCHRDYHGQNIHLFNKQLYMIDYQDMRMGPDTYDLASLLRDRGVARVIGSAREDSLVDYYAVQLGAGKELTQRYFETLLQRSIKILGTFAKQAIVRNKQHYLEFIPPTLESIARCLDQLEHFEGFRSFFPLRPAA